MNYQRVREQAKLKAYVKQKLAEKRDLIRSKKGEEKYKIEQLIIKKAKEEFMGFSNRKNKSEIKDEKITGEQSQGSENSENESGQNSEGKSEESESDSLDNSEVLDENDHPVENEVKLDEMSSEELVEFAKENQINIGNAKKKETLLKIIKGE